MIYGRVEDKENNSLLEISAYNVGKGVAEYNLIIKISDPSLIVADQIECLNKTCNRFVENEAETYDIMSTYTRHLGSVGATLADNCLRTWIFVDDIDNNYGTMVDARNAFFEKEGLTEESHYIASTGIECGMGAYPHSVQMDAYAVGGIHKEQITFLKSASHLNPTSEFGVSFERGTMFEYEDRRHVIISGTASINNKGMTVGPGDIKEQIKRMVENVDILLSESGCCYGDVAHMIVYLRNSEDFETVDSYFRENFGNIPMVILHAPVCRKGWLIEMECMAIKYGGSDRFPVL